MSKDFDKWNTNKKLVQEKSNVPFCHEREIWWCELGINIGFEQDGSHDSFRRPILVLKNMSKNTFIGIPLTTSLSKHKFRFEIGEVDGKTAQAILSQIKVIDTKRLVSKVTVLAKPIFEQLRKAVKAML